MWNLRGDRDRPLWPCLPPKDAQDRGGEGTTHPEPESDGPTLRRADSTVGRRSQRSRLQLVPNPSSVPLVPPASFCHSRQASGR